MDKIILDQIRSKATLHLPSSKLTVEVWNELLTGEVAENIAVSAQGTIGGQDILGVITHLIADWNAYDSAGEKLPITVENVKKLPIADFTVLASHIQHSTQGIGVEEKKG